MLTLTIPAGRFFNEQTNEFIYTEEQTLQMEHSLVSLSKWEARWHKPFLSTDKTDEEIMDYIKIMTITKHVNPLVYSQLSQSHVNQIVDYINNPMTATTFRKDSEGGKNNRIVTAELVYCWMIMLNIPVEFQKWHLNKLMTLIRVCQAENSPNDKKRSQREINSRHAAINNARRQKHAKKGR